MGSLESKENPDCKVIDVAFGSSRYRRMSGMTVGISQSSGVDTLRYISCMHGSVTMLGDSMCQLIIWNTMETFTNPGSCSSAFKMSITRLPADTFVHKNSSVMLGKVWGPWNDEIPFKDRIFKYRKRPSRRPEGSSKVCSQCHKSGGVGDDRDD